MYECRCPHDGHKLLEMARPPLSRLGVKIRCPCGEKANGRVFSDGHSGIILAVAVCACGRKTVRPVGDLVAVRCRTCKKIITF
ncbi:MAG TPA: hypothetical protein PLU95_06540 [Syntrophales bacterium]|nr:hypothetical protein [Syntrophales bacterium]HOD98198.1 hypothetical protein [Syntrophales bacterium]HOH73662.1 hypothetical protein [Syntrophales bacterium]HPN08942.1 hypothetical protein [Syntrophales bacterium]HPX80586.1 hypothetical protein [Syntrophales bacterium]